MNGETCHHKIIKLLKEQKEPIKKETIAQNVHNSIETVAKALTELKSPNKYVVEFSGFWSITELGKELPPNFDKSYYERAKQKESETASRVFWEQLLPPELIENNNITRSILEHADEFRVWKEAEAILLPFVMLWLVANKVEPKYTFSSEYPEIDTEVEEILLKLQSLAKTKIKR